MDRPDPSPAAPSSGLGASSSAPPNTTPGPAVALDSTSAPGAQGTTSTSAPAPSSEAPEPRPVGPESQHARASPTTTNPSSPQRPRTPDQSQPTAPLQQPRQPPHTQPTLEAVTIPDPRPATGSTLGGPGTEHRSPNPPTPPSARPPLPQLRLGRSTSADIIIPSAERLEDVDTLSGHIMPELHRDGTLRNQPLPAPPQARLVDNGFTPRRQRTLESHGSVLGQGPARRSGIDWMDEKRKRTVGQRIQPTLEIAITERDKYAAKAKTTGWILNSAIGLQVILGSLTTGLSAVATTGRQTAIQTTVLGALTTLVASYLARARGSNEPDLSITRVKDLDHFIREVKAFQLDYGHIDTDDWDKEIDRLRKRFEELLGNASGERKLAPPV